MNDFIYLKDVVTLKLDAEKCNGCRMCLIVCPHAVFEMRDKIAVIVNKDACMECGACEQNCSEDAIEVKAGVGCAAAIIQGAIKGTEASCGCDTDSCC